VTRLKFAAIMTRFDSGFLEQARADTRRIREGHNQLQAALAGLWEAREEASRERQRLTLMEEERRAVLVALQRERQETEKALTELQENEQRLSTMLVDLERQRQSSLGSDAGTGSSLARLAGGLDWPVVGEVVRKFGRSVHPEFKTVTLNNGINIAAPVGTPVFAIAEGLIEFGDHLPGFGLCVILDHGAGYYSLYANLARLFVVKGERVEANQVLAEVGRSDQESGSQLYFEIRQGKQPLDPLLWLKPRN
jgi:septal ring factor EnvC (AmiA/AmiB activator)